jgi:hypothetical protein
VIELVVEVEALLLLVQIVQLELLALEVTVHQQILQDQE